MIRFFCTLLFTLTILLSTTVSSQINQIWGMTSDGGTHYSTGAIFKLDANGNNQSLVHSFYKPEGDKPFYVKLCQAANGKLYGMTSEGGSWVIGSPGGVGIIFEFDPITNGYTKKIDFDGSNKGSTPKGSLMEATNGKLYGMTSSGGVHNRGVLFEYDPVTNIYIKKIDFDGLNNGARPNGALVEASNGKLYGMTREGGIDDRGVLFEFDPNTNIYIKKIDFDGPNKGRWPIGSLMEATNGKLYGLTREGGIDDRGVLFEYNPSNNIYMKKVEFDGNYKGRLPGTSLIQATNGKLYGMTSAGGVSGYGVIFEYEITTNTYVLKFEFDGSNNGSRPTGSLMEASNGKLYGTTSDGGSILQGVLFEYDPRTDIYTKKIDFGDTINPGGTPLGSLIEATNGKLYGVTSSSEKLFEYDYNTNTYIVKIEFGKATNGKSPYGSLMKASNGKLYGMTRNGGLFNYGVIFEYNPTTDIYTKKIDLGELRGYLNEGIEPYGSLVEASNGKLYGMTLKGGLNNYGVIFEYNPITNDYIKKIDFDDSIKGKHPYGSLIEAANGKLYGMTRKGGSDDVGVLFQYNPTTNTYTKIIDFDIGYNGAFPYGSLMEASNGKLYGMTSIGGSRYAGVLFELDPITNTYTVKFNLDPLFGYQSYGSLIEATNGKLYGMTSKGGINDDGVIFEYDLNTNIYAKKFDFDFKISGKNPFGSLMEASNGKLYGMTNDGGRPYIGLVFEFNPISNIYTKKFQFDYKNGSRPGYGALIEINGCFSTSSSINSNTCANTYTSPSGKIWTTSNTYVDTIPNVCGADSIITINLTLVDTSTITNGSTIASKQIGASYRWLNCNSKKVIKNETGQTYTALFNGSYAVEITVGSCVDTSSCVTLSTVGIIENNFENNFMVYPNPSDGNFSVDLGFQYNSIDIFIWNIHGKLIQTKTLRQTEHFNLSIEEPPGFYFISIIGDKKVKNIRLIKE